MFTATPKHDDMTIFMPEQVRDMHLDEGARAANKPLILFEYSLLWPYESDPEGVLSKTKEAIVLRLREYSRLCANTFDYLEGPESPNLGYALDNNRLVQQWMWFSFCVTTKRSLPRRGQQFVGG
ncbi:MAG: hypothetical protein IPM76_20920 [Chloroflexi bacterium]|nr:hypothetical protein [Chloroflexota bacterium]